MKINLNFRDASKASHYRAAKNNQLLSMPSGVPGDKAI